MLKSGLYGLFRLDGGPIAAADAQALALPAPTGHTSASARAVDVFAPGALHRVEDAGGLTLLAGDVAEAAQLAARLGLARDVSPALLARAALTRFGGDTPREMLGEWSLLHWERSARLTLVQSAARRDPLLFAIDGARVAVASDIFRLAEIGWIGTTLDEAGLLLGLGRAALRARVGASTMLARVRQLEPAQCVTIDRDGCRTQVTDAFTPQPRWTGSFEDALAEAERVLRAIVRDGLARAEVAMCLLSGGLDSSTLAWLAAEERGADRDLRLMTSVAPPGSGIPDESHFADAVAERLGLTTEHVVPAEAVNIYRPHDAILRGANRPPLSNRHCLTDAFQIAARAHGATTMLDGVFGEYTLTGSLTIQTPRTRLRRLARRIRGLRSPPARERAAFEHFHVRLSPARLAMLPDAVRGGLRDATLPEAEPRPDAPLGYVPGAGKAMLQANEFYPGAVRMALPFRDLRLLRLFAGLPAKFLIENRVPRAPVRHMLAGHLPDSIRLRRSGMPASPDHMARLQRQAPLARARIADFRMLDVHQWLDLDWLDAALARIAANGPASVGEANEVQLTAMTAEFFAWWRARS